MSSAECLREFVKERLTAAAEEIFSVFKTTIVQYEQEIDRQRKLLDIVWKPEVKLQRIEIPQQHVCKEEEVHAEQQLSNKDCNSSVIQKEPEPPQIKEEQHGPFTSEEGEEVTLKHESHSFLLTPTHEESDDCETEPESNHQPLSHNSHVTETQHKIRGKHGGSASTRDAGSKSRQRKIDTNGVKDFKLSRISRNGHTDEKPFKCQTCGKAFKKKTVLRRHLRVHTGERPYSCDTCGKHFRFGSAFKIHLRTPKGERPHTCRACKRAFYSTSNLIIQMRKHTGEKPYSCDTCGKRFNTAQYLKEHMTIHTGEKAYTCETCGKHFRYGAVFKDHLKIHTGERTHTCSICKRDFYSTSNLKIHMRTHTGEKPFTCKTCGRHFRFCSSFKVHLRTHTGERPHTCSTCKKAFYSTSNLKIHMRTHTGEKPFTCTTCGKPFRVKGNLQRHIKTHTGCSRARSVGKDMTSQH